MAHRRHRRARARRAAYYHKRHHRRRAAAAFGRRRGSLSAGAAAVLPTVATVGLTALTITGINNAFLLNAAPTQNRLGVAFSGLVGAVMMIGGIFAKSEGGKLLGYGVGGGLVAAELGRIINDKIPPVSTQQLPAAQSPAQLPSAPPPSVPRPRGLGDAHSRNGDAPQGLPTQIVPPVGLAASAAAAPFGLPGALAPAIAAQALDQRGLNTRGVVYDSFQILQSLKRAA